jgi:hypothetical protein
MQLPKEGRMPESSLADDLVRIHKVFTRAVRVSVEAAAGFVKDAPEPGLLQGFRLYVEMLFLGLHAHHESEETVAWPYTRARNLPAPYETLIEQHGRIATRVDAGQKALGGGDLRALHAHLNDLQGLWLGHFPLEEAAFGPAAWPGPLTPEEEAELGSLVARHQARMMEANADYQPVGLAFVLYNLEPEDRAIWASEMPAQVIEELVPGPWLVRWAPMKPFLLA